MKNHKNCTVEVSKDIIDFSGLIIVDNLKYLFTYKKQSILRFYQVKSKETSVDVFI